MALCNGTDRACKVLYYVIWLLLFKYYVCFYLCESEYCLKYEEYESDRWDPLT